MNEEGGREFDCKNLQIRFCSYRRPTNHSGFFSISQSCTHFIKMKQHWPRNDQKHYMRIPKQRPRWLQDSPNVKSMCFSPRVCGKNISSGNVQHYYLTTLLTTKTFVVVFCVFCRRGCEFLLFCFWWITSQRPFCRDELKWDVRKVVKVVKDAVVNFFKT